MSRKKNPNTNARASSADDKALGAKIRAFRNLAKISQAELGAALDPPVSFQQIQKYEKGVNRVAHSKLVQICKALGCTMADMTAELKGEGQSQAASNELLALMGDNATMRLVKAFATLPRDMQFQFVGLVERVSHDRAA